MWRFCGLVVLVALSGCEQEKKRVREASAAESACMTRAIEAANAQDLAEAEASMASTTAAIDSGNFAALFDTDFVDEAISDRNHCTAFAACFENIAQEYRQMYVQKCTTDKMQERLDQQL